MRLEARELSCRSSTALAEKMPFQDRSQLDKGLDDVDVHEDSMAPIKCAVWFGSLVWRKGVAFMLSSRSSFAGRLFPVRFAMSPRGHRHRSGSDC